MLANLFSVGQLFWIQIVAGLSTGILFSYCTAEAMRDVSPQKKSTAMGYHQAIYAEGAVAFLGFIMAACFYFFAGNLECKMKCDN